MAGESKLRLLRKGKQPSKIITLPPFLADGRFLLWQQRTPKILKNLLNNVKYQHYPNFKIAQSTTFPLAGARIKITCQ